MSIEEFARSVCECVKDNLPPELGSADVRTVFLDVGEGAAHLTLLVRRPWDHTATGFYLESWYQGCLAGEAAVMDAVSAVINDRRLYRMPS